MPIIDARKPVALGVLISGSGTNLQAIIDAIARAELAAEIRVVISNRADAHGLERARNAGLPAVVIDHRKFATREDFDRELATVLTTHGVELVVLAGFLRLLSPIMLRAFPQRILNIHPSLLPAFPGLHAQRAALEYGVRLTGCTVFLVTEGLDDGPIIIQASVPVLQGDTEQTLSERILVQEHRIYPLAISMYQSGSLRIDGRRVIIADPVPENDGALINPLCRRG